MIGLCFVHSPGVAAGFREWPFVDQLRPGNSSIFVQQYASCYMCIIVYNIMHYTLYIIYKYYTLL